MNLSKTLAIGGGGWWVVAMVENNAFSGPNNKFLQQGRVWQLPNCIKDFKCLEYLGKWKNSKFLWFGGKVKSVFEFIDFLGMPLCFFVTPLELPLEAVPAAVILP